MSSRRWFYFLSLFLVSAVLNDHPVSARSIQDKPGKSGRSARSATKTPTPLLLTVQDVAREFTALFESQLAQLDRGLKGVLKQMDRPGMDPLELLVLPQDRGNKFWLILTVKNFIPKSSGPWDKQDVLSFQALGEGPVYLNLSLLQGLVKAMADYRAGVLAKSAQSTFSLDSWKVILEKKEGHSLRFEGRFHEGRQVIQPSVFLKQKAPELEIKADGEAVAEALSRGTFPLPPKMLGGQFSSTKALLEFFGKE